MKLLERGALLVPAFCWSVPSKRLAGAELLLAGRHLLAETGQLVTAEDLLVS